MNEEWDDFISKAVDDFISKEEIMEKEQEAKRVERTMKLCNLLMILSGIFIIGVLLFGVVAIYRL